jgi:Ca-activated chloride channel family protein
MMRFENISSFYFLLIIPVVIFLFFWLNQWKKKRIQSIGDEALINKLVIDKAQNKPILKLILKVMAIASLCIALMNPQIGSKIEEVKREGANIILALDVSKSMLAEDESPSRLQKGKMIISKLIDQLAGDRVGLIIYAGQAYTLVPSTSDYSAIKMQLNSIHSNMLSSQGTAISQVLELSKTAFETNSESSQSIIILSDGEDHEGEIDAGIQGIKEFGVELHTVGLGSDKGAPIPTDRSGKSFKKDRQGNVVITKLDEAHLQKMALETNGSYIKGSSVTQTVDHLISKINQFESTEFESKKITDYESQYTWFVYIAFVLLLIDFLLSNKKSHWWRKLNLFGSYEK